MIATTDKPTASPVTKAEKVTAPLPPPPTPIQALNHRIAEAKKAATARLEQIRRDRAAHEKTWPPVIPDTAGPAQAAQIEAAWQNERDRLRRAERNFSDVETLMELDDAKDARQLLGKALDYLKEKAEKVQQQPQPAPVKGDETKHVFQPADALPPQTPLVPHAPVAGGLFGQVIEIPISEELAAFEAEVKRFPENLPFYKIVDQANKVDGRLFRASPPPPMVKRMDRPFIPKWG